MENKFDFVDSRASWFTGGADIGLTQIGTQMCAVSGVNAMLYLASVAELGPAIEHLIQNNTQHMTNYVKTILMMTIDTKLQREGYKPLASSSPLVPLWYVFHDGFTTGANMSWQRRAEVAFRIYSFPGGIRERYRHDGLETHIGKAVATKIHVSDYAAVMQYPLAVILSVTRNHAPELFGEIMRVLKGACVENRMANFIGEFATSEGVRDLFR